MMHENIFAPTDRQILIGIFISYGIREEKESAVPVKTSGRMTTSVF